MIQKTVLTFETALPSKQVKSFCEKNPDKVWKISYEGGYDTPNGRAYDVLMAPGWSVDLWGDHMHTIIEGNSKDVLRILRTAKYCGCDKPDCCCCHG